MSKTSDKTEQLDGDALESNITESQVRELIPWKERLNQEYKYAIGPFSKPPKIQGWMSALLHPEPNAPVHPLTLKMFSLVKLECVSSKVKLKGEEESVMEVERKLTARYFHICNLIDDYDRFEAVYPGRIVDYEKRKSKLEAQANRIANALDGKKATRACSKGVLMQTMFDFFKAEGVNSSLASYINWAKHKRDNDKGSGDYEFHEIDENKNVLDVENFETKERATVKLDGVKVTLSNAKKTFKKYP